MSLKIALLGYGRMGKEIEKVATERCHDISEIFDIERPLTKQVKINAVDVFIDFTQPDCVPENVKLAAELGKPIVVGTTGWDEQFMEVEKIILQSKTGLLYASNFSVGVHLFFEIAEKAQPK